MITMYFIGFDIFEPIIYFWYISYFVELKISKCRLQRIWRIDGSEDNQGYQNLSFIDFKKEPSPYLLSWTHEPWQKKHCQPVQEYPSAHLIQSFISQSNHWSELPVTSHLTNSVGYPNYIGNLILGKPNLPVQRHHWPYKMKSRLENGLLSM